MIQQSRTLILDMSRIVGKLSEVFQWKGNHPSFTLEEFAKIPPLINNLKTTLNQFQSLATIENLVNISMIDYVLPPINTQFSELSIEDLRKRIKQWCDDRDWEKYHTPRNILMAMIGEVGELTELFPQEMQPGVPELSAEQKHHLGEECSDVLHNLIRLCDRCEIDLSLAIQQKMQKNSKKYPIQQVKGSSLKYDEYK